MRSEWTLANNKNNELCNVVFGDNVARLTQAEYRRYYSTNGNALDAFLARKEAGLSLSDRVWRYSDTFRNEIEMGLDIGIRSGLDAPAMARELQTYLQHPDKLFRRVADEHGHLHLSKAAAAFHPGRGVYRSSYMNARRLAATETNIAYRTADHLRWQQTDFVVGIKIQLSNNHNCRGVPEGAFFDICDELKGDYPKDFKFTGWHPHCRCYATPILKTPEELAADNQRIMQGEEPAEESENEVTDLPENFNAWLDRNEERIARAKSLPYFLRDNGVLNNGKYTLNDFGSEGGSTERITDTKNPVATKTSGLYEGVSRNNYLNGRLGKSTIEVVEIAKIPGGGLASYKNGVIYISQETDAVVRRLLNGGTSHDDYLKLEELFHELNHSIADTTNLLKQIRGGAFNGYDSATISMEVMNEIRSRQRLPEFCRALGIKEPELLDYEARGLRAGYNGKIRTLKRVIEELNVDEQAILRAIGDATEHSDTSLANILAQCSQLPIKQAEHVVRNMYGYYQEWLDDALIAAGRYSGKLSAAERVEAFKRKFGADFPNLRKPYDADIAVKIAKKYKYETATPRHLGAQGNKAHKPTKARELLNEVPTPKIKFSAETLEYTKQQAQKIGAKMTEPKSMNNAIAHANTSGDSDNCQSSVVAFFARLLGMDVTAVEYKYGGEFVKLLENDQTLAYFTSAKNKIHPVRPRKLMSADEVMNFIDKETAKEGIYNIAINRWENKSYGHIMCLIKHKGKPYVVDIQGGLRVDLEQELKRASFETLSNGEIRGVEILRIDKLVLSDDAMKVLLPIN